MFNYGWNMMLKKVEETLDIYPQLKGLQVMSDEGGYLFPGYRGKWIPDTPVQRKAVLDKLRTFNVFSNSSPIEGIDSAFKIRRADGSTTTIGGDDRFEILEPAIHRKIRHVPVAHPAAALVVADEAKMISEELNPVAPQRAFDVVQEMCQGPDAGRKQ